MDYITYVGYNNAWMYRCMDTLRMLWVKDFCDV